MLTQKIERKNKGNVWQEIHVDEKCFPSAPPFTVNPSWVCVCGVSLCLCQGHIHDLARKRNRPMQKTAWAHAVRVWKQCNSNNNNNINENSNNCKHSNSYNNNQNKNKSIFTHLGSKGLNLLWCLQHSHSKLSLILISLIRSHSFALTRSLNRTHIRGITSQHVRCATQRWRWAAANVNSVARNVSHNDLEFDSPNSCWLLALSDILSGKCSKQRETEVRAVKQITASSKTSSKRC